MDLKIKLRNKAFFVRSKYIAICFNEKNVSLLRLHRGLQWQRAKAEVLSLVR